MRALRRSQGGTILGDDALARDVGATILATRVGVSYARLDELTLAAGLGRVFPPLLKTLLLSLFQEGLDILRDLTLAPLLGGHILLVWNILFNLERA